LLKADSQPALKVFADAPKAIRTGQLARAGALLADVEAAERSIGGKK
jgi:hypothetical protein